MLRLTWRHEDTQEFAERAARCRAPQVIATLNQRTRTRPCSATSPRCRYHDATIVSDAMHDEGNKKYHSISLPRCCRAML